MKKTVARSEPVQNSSLELDVRRKYFLLLKYIFHGIRISSYPDIKHQR